MAQKTQSMKEVVLTVALAVCGKAPKTITPEQYKKILSKTSRRKVKGKKITRDCVNNNLRKGGYARTRLAGQDPRVLKVVKEAYREVQKLPLSEPEAIVMLRERLVIEVAAIARSSGLKELQWSSILDIGRKAKFGKWPNVRLPAAAKKALKEKEPLTDEVIAGFMTEGRSYQEVSLKFTLPLDDVETRLEEGLKGYDLFKGPKNLKGEQTYTAVPETGNDRPLKKVWSHRSSTVPGQPYIACDFPDDFNHRKIRIVPIDSILYGHSDHDSERLAKAIQFIKTSPQTFCYLNGGIIAPVVGGRREVKNALIIQRGQECEELLKPIAHKILWAQQGPQEAQALKSQKFDPLAHLCDRFDVPYFDQPIHADICWRGNIWHIFTIHGRSSAQKKGSKMNALGGITEFQDFTHFYVMGKMGDAMLNENVIVDRDTVNMTLDVKKEYHVFLSDFKKYLGTDTARKGYAPSTKAVMVLYMYPNGDYHVKTRSGDQ